MVTKKRAVISLARAPGRTDHNEREIKMVKTSVFLQRDAANGGQIDEVGSISIIRAAR